MTQTLRSQLPENARVEYRLTNRPINGSRLVYLIWQGKPPAWGKVMRPALELLARALTGERAFGRGGVFFAGGVLAAEDAQAYFQAHLAKPATERPLWAVWTGAGFKDAFTGELLASATPDEIAAELTPRRAPGHQWIETEAGEPLAELPDPCEVHLWYGGFGEITPGSNFFYVVYPEKAPAFHKILLPSMRQLMRRLTGLPLQGSRNKRSGELEGGWQAEGVSPNEARQMFAHDRAQPLERRRLWLVWTGRGYRSLFTGQPV